MGNYLLKIEQENNNAMLDPGTNCQPVFTSKTFFFSFAYTHTPKRVLWTDQCSRIEGHIPDAKTLCDCAYYRAMLNKNRTNFVENGWPVSGVMLEKRDKLLEQQCSHAANFALLFDKDLKVLVDDRHSQEDSCTGTDGTQEVGHDRQPSYAKATEGSSCGDVPVELVHHRSLSVSPHNHLLFLQLFSHIFGRGS